MSKKVGYTSERVKPGGKQPVMRASLYNGEVQEMTLPDGTLKGIKIVLEERGVCTKKMVKEDILKTYEDVKNSKTILCELIEGRGHMCIYIPKFHCELNPIERCWCQAKKHTIIKFFQKSKYYEKAYSEGYTTENVDSIVKM